MAISVQQLFDEALAALNCRNLKKAEEGFRRVLRQDHSHAAALNLLAVVLMSSGRFGDAEPFIARAVALNKNSDVSFYNYGLIAKNLGKPQLALDQFTKALTLNANVPETWNNRGAVHNDLGRYELAISDFNRAIQINPNYAEGHANKGKSLSLLKRYDEALAAYDQALSVKPGLENAWFGRGNVFTALRRYDEALAAYDKALSIKPDLENAWLDRGNVCWSLERYDEASVAYDRALSIKPDLENAWLGRGNVYWKFKRYDEALAAYDKALSIKPDLEGAWLGRGNVFADLERYDEALAAYDKALSIRPDFEGAWLGRGDVFTDLERYDEAFSAYDRALSIRPDLENAWLGRGNIFTALKRYDEALAAYDKALSIKPDLESVWLGRGNVYRDLKRYDEALAAYDKAIALNESFAEAHYSKALVLLLLRQFQEGWPLYEFRHQTTEYVGGIPLLKSLKVQTRVEPIELKDKNVLVLAEQGVGDEIMFAGMLPDLIADAKNITYEVDIRLMNVMRRSFPTVAFVPRQHRRSLNAADFDVVMFSGSLGFTYRRDMFPKRAYLVPDPPHALRMRERLANDAPGKMRIGVSWRGGTVKTRINDRSLGREYLHRILQKPEFYFVNLQYGAISDELMHFNSGRNPILHQLMTDFNDFDSFAALMSELDLIISVQNTTVHMSGALGKRCWGMIPWQPEWRYGLEEKEMIWYPSVQLYRQSELGNWDDVIERIKNELDNME